MKTTGIIAEYNPFHNGHKYHLEQARLQTNADYMIVIMSGDYTQRGTPAIYSKYLRAKAALTAGADLVLEMPVFGAVASAPDFARTGVNGLAATGVCDHLFFGSESGNIDTLSRQADLLDNESKELSDAIKSGLKNGLTWPQARAQAYQTVGSDGADNESAVSSLPNDILGVEYIRAIRESGCSLTPVTLQRNDPGYHSEEKFGQFASATAARKAIHEGNLSFLQEVLPDEWFECLKEASYPPITFNDCSLLLGEKLLRATLDDLTSISSMPDDLARKLYKHQLDFMYAEDMVTARKDRNYTYTRVNRSLLNFMLGITKDDAQLFKDFSYVPWIRILGFRKDASPLLSELKKNTTVPVITKVANADSILADSSLKLFRKQIQASETYRLISQLKSNRVQKNEYTHSVIIV